ncbi:DUF882 domain-containing protein [Janibacter melonis]|uniref:DUF882 domain-containing protein n=1 Tax=Janibacter melonis TaxID=262209 RepID=A0A5P8FKV1_9MICO|nr:D-Ala-D-Ala carboxypeptidase family metallohydrolase [Janibacter melonis]QFQ29700.2 DUF882 domain-containing protein [Janibacter melonis]
MNVIDRRRAAWHLRKLGWNTSGRARLDQAIRDFQGGYTRTTLKADGVLGAKTMAAILESSSFRSSKKRGGTASPNFNFTEFACKCGGKYAGCRRIVVDRDLVRGLEKLRAKHYPRGLNVVSGYRCPAHNKAVGGATASQHMSGKAADIPSIVKAESVRALGVFGGVGVTARTGTVAHVDVRPGSATWLYN